tara:strand:+ start:717 stop:1232 length:516 start_codon:yes stop_codon:yes gene_type:complete
MTDREKFINICNLTTNIVGLHHGDLCKKTRKSGYVVPRMVASVIGILANDIHPTIISDVIKRDRSTVLHYRKLHKFNYQTFPTYRELFNEVYSAYNTILSNKLIFINDDSLKSYLINSGIENIKKPQVKIKIKSGLISHTINTNYLLCSDLIIKIKNVLENYDYTLDIKTI